MTAAAVRAAIKAYFDAASIDGVSKVYRAVPYWIDGNSFQTFVESGWGAVLAVHIDQSNETRATLPAPNTLGGPVGNKAVHHRVGLVLVYQWLVPTDSPGVDAWVDPLDQIVDDVVAALRADPNLGAPDVIFQAAQQPSDITILRSMPRMSEDEDGPGVVHVQQLIEFTATEIVTA